MIIIRPPIVLFKRKRRTSIYSSCSFITEQRKGYTMKNNIYQYITIILTDYDESFFHMFITFIHIFSFLNVENDKCTVLFFFFFFHRRRRWRKRDFTFLFFTLLFECTHTFMLYNLTYICPLARLLVE